MNSTVRIASAKCTVKHTNILFHPNDTRCWFVNILIDWLLIDIKLTVFTAIFMTRTRLLKNIHIVGRYVGLGWVEYSITTGKGDFLPWNRSTTTKWYCSSESYCKSSIMSMESDIFPTWDTRLRHFIRTSLLGLSVIVFNATLFNLYRGVSFIGRWIRSTRRKPPTCRN